jgi:hypothetical protein
MKQSEDILILPFTNTSREYGYIMWAKERDDEIKAFFCKNDFIDINFKNVIQKQKRVDWNKRRVAITYTLTRSIPTSSTKIKMKRIGKNKFNIFFK